MNRRGTKTKLVQGGTNPLGNLAWSPPDRTQHQENAKQGKYGSAAKKINAAREKKQKMLDLLNE